jgi:hypothetical protein
VIIITIQTVSNGNAGAEGSAAVQPIVTLPSPPSPADDDPGDHWVTILRLAVASARTQGQIQACFWELPVYAAAMGSLQKWPLMCPSVHQGGAPEPQPLRRRRLAATNTETPAATAIPP